MTTGKTIALTIWTFVGKVVSLLFNALYRFVIVFLPRSKRLIISWLQSTSTVILEPKKIKSATVFTFFPSICHEVAFSLAKPYSSGFCSNSLPGPLFSIPLQLRSLYLLVTLILRVESMQGGGKDIGDSDMEKQRHKVKNSEIRIRENCKWLCIYDAQNRV